jgi:hypothetical protein
MNRRNFGLPQGKNLSYGIAASKSGHVIIEDLDHLQYKILPALAEHLAQDLIDQTMDAGASRSVSCKDINGWTITLKFLRAEAAYYVKRLHNSNTSSVSRHDPEFAKVYLPEKRLMLGVLDRADSRLLDIAKRQLKS